MIKQSKEQLHDRVIELENRNFDLNRRISELETKIDELKRHERWYEEDIKKRDNQIHFLAWMLTDKWVAINKYINTLDVIVQQKWLDTDE